MIANQQARQADSKPLMITKQLTDEEREYGKEQSAALMKMFG